MACRLSEVYNCYPPPIVCAMCWYAGPGWPEVMEAMSGTPELAAYLRRRFRSYASCWVHAARRQIVCKALADRLISFPFLLQSLPDRPVHSQIPSPPDPA